MCYNMFMTRYARRLDGKTFVITGVTSGIGRGLAQKLISDNGCRVIGVGRSVEKMASLVSALGENARLLDGRLFDVSQRENWLSLASSLISSGVRIDGIVNGAGILPHFANTGKTTPENVEKALKTNFLATVYAVDALRPALCESPVIVNISSAAALAAIAGTGAYSASKSALKSYTEALRAEMRGKGQVSLIMPGFARTEIFREQNTAIESSRLFMMMSMPADKMVAKIYRAVARGRRRAVIGKDAKAMDFLYRLLPSFAPEIISSVIRRAKTPLFSDVFDD